VTRTMSNRGRRRRGRLLVVLGVLLVWAVAAHAGNTYVTDLSPNPEVEEPDCYSFDINVAQASGATAILTLRVFDVDEEAGELDEVSLNGVDLGYLTGDNDVWSVTAFDVSGVVVYGGDNTVEICIDPLGGESTTWVAEIDWGQILVDGGSMEDADIVSVSASGTWDAIQVDTLVHATNTATYELEINLLDSLGSNKDIASDVFPLTGGTSTTRSSLLAVPTEPPATETFTLEVNLFNRETGVQQAVATAEWTHHVNTPPDGADSSISTDEDAGYAFALTDFAYSDVDGDPLVGVRIVELETVGDLELDGVPVSVSQVVTASQLDAGRLTYLPRPDESGSPYDGFRFRVFDGTDYSSSDYAMDIEVTPVDDPLLALDDRYETPEETPLAVSAPGVLMNDTLGDGVATVLVVLAPNHGEVRLDASGGLLYEPNPRYSGADRFVYEITDLDGDVASATVEIDVLHVNRIPVADAGGVYYGVVGEEIELSGRFSRDGNIEDRLQYRWDVDGDGAFDTEWQDEPMSRVVYDSAFLGYAVLEVRDLYRFVPTGARSTARAMVVVLPRPPEIQSVLFLDLDGNGIRDESDVGLPEIPLLLDGETLIYTDEQGQVRFPDLAPGEHRLEIPEAGLELLAGRGYGVEEFAVTAMVAPGEPTVVTFATQRIVGSIRGTAFVDLDGSGNREETEPGIAEVTVVLDGETVRTTAEDGLFLFLHVHVGEHRLVLSRDGCSKTLDLVVLGGVDTVIQVACEGDAEDGFLKLEVQREPVGVAEDGE